MNDMKYVAIMLEDIQSTVKGLAEGLSNVQQTVNRIDATVEKMAPDVELIPAIKAAATDQTRDINRVDHAVGDHEERLRALEQAA